VNEHDESAPRARNTRKSRALKRPSRWLEKRISAASSRPTAIPGESPLRMARPALEPVRSLEPEPAASFDDHAADFFREGETPSSTATVELDVEAVDEDRAGERGLDRVRLAAAARRRAFSRHVMGVVAFSVALCIAAFVRSATGGSPSAAAPSPTAPPVVAAADLPRVAPFQIPAAEVAATPAPTPPVAPAAVAEVAPIPARASREEARHALDRGAAEAAIAAGLHSVELDPTDADAWLILGAAYQLAGKGPEARSAFYSCSKLAKRGDVRECRALVP
jgi:hypothetical protein